MTFKSNAVYICDQCGKEVAGDSVLTCIEGWYKLERQEREKDGECWCTPESVGDFCSLECLRAFVSASFPAVASTAEFLT